MSRQNAEERRLGGVIRRRQGAQIQFLAVSKKRPGGREEWTLPKIKLPAAASQSKDKWAKIVEEATGLSPLRYIASVGRVKYAYRPPETARIVIKDLEGIMLDWSGAGDPAPSSPGLNAHRVRWMTYEDLEKNLRYIGELRLYHNALQHK